MGKISKKRKKKKKTKQNPFPLQVAFGQYFISAAESKLKQIGIVNMGYCSNRLDCIVGRKLNGIFCGSLEIMLRKIQMMKIWLVKFQRRV